MFTVIAIFTTVITIFITIGIFHFSISLLIIIIISLLFILFIYICLSLLFCYIDLFAFTWTKALLAGWSWKYFQSKEDAPYHKQYRYGYVVCISRKRLFRTRARKRGWNCFRWDFADALRVCRKKHSRPLFWLAVWNMNFIFPYIGNNHPNWLIFFRGVETTNHFWKLRCWREVYV